MAADNQTTIAGNLVDTPELRFTNNGTPVTICGSRSPSASSKTGSGVTVTPRSSRSMCGAAKPNTWRTPCPKATG
jgi:hypothetical protein